MDENAHNDNGNNNIFKIVMNLTAACVIASFIIAVVYYLTMDVISKNTIEFRNSSMKMLVKDADNFKPILALPDWFEAVKDNKTIAYVLPVESKGYGGTMKLLVAVKPDKKVLNFSILESKETPGLGDKAAKEPFHNQFIGKRLENLIVVKGNENKDSIQAISGATITSKAVTNGIREAVTKVQDFLIKEK